jgi:ABC-2 type transport system permease protein
MKKIKTIVRKEWAEVFKNRMILFTVAFLPLIMTAIPLGILFALRSEGSIQGMDADIPRQFGAFCPTELSEGDCFQVYMVSQFIIMFMIIPLAIPSTISAYSIVGEKATHSLEPLLATPITTTELLIGKSLAALIPAVVATYVAFGIYALGAWFMLENKVVFSAMMDVRWLLAVYLVGPLLALMAVNFSIMVSSRVNDPRVAEQLSALIIVPILAIFFGQLSGLFILNRQLILLIAVVLVVIDAILVYLSERLFQRETILTRWK